MAVFDKNLLDSLSLKKPNKDAELNYSQQEPTSVFNNITPNSVPHITEIQLSQIDDFENHPFKVLDNTDMDELVDSIKSQGQLSPAIVRQKPSGRYEMISGHRRLRALIVLGYKSIKAEVKNVTDDEAIIIMADANLSRSELLPSEKAFSYKAKLEALKREASKLNKETADKSINQLEQDTKDSRSTIQRLIRLTELIEPILDQIDNKEMSVLVGVELSYLTTEEQFILYNYLTQEDKRLSVPQAKGVRKFQQTNGITEKNIFSIFKKSNKPPKKEVYKINKDDFEELTNNSSMSNKDFTKLIKEALEFYINSKNT